MGSQRFIVISPTGRTSGFFLEVEDARQIDFVDLHARLPFRLDLGLAARRLVARFFEGVSELEAEGGERFRIGFSLIRAGERAVDARREAHEDALGELDVRVLRRRSARFAGGVGGAHRAAVYY